MRRRERFGWIRLAGALLLAPLAPVVAQETGRVELPLGTYEAMLAARSPSATPGYVLGAAKVDVLVSDSAARSVGAVEARLSIEVQAPNGALVPLLPPGTVLDSVLMNGKSVQLVITPEGPAWSAAGPGTATFTLTYRIDVARSPDGFTLAVPLPRAASIDLTATLPGAELDAVVLPATSTQIEPGGGAPQTRIKARVPPAPGAQISWRAPARRTQAVGRAYYTGKLDGDAVSFRAELRVDGFSERASIVPLIARGVTLSGLKVDGREAPILVEDERYATLIKGTGPHRVDLEFLVPVVRAEGPPRIDLVLPQVPVTRIELTLPGDKEVDVTPASAVALERLGPVTVATVFLPMVPNVSLTWSEAVPVEAAHELRTAATVHHVVHADEGVLYVRARVEYEVNRGATHEIELDLPAAVQVDRVESASGAIAEWMTREASQGEPRRLVVYLDRDLEGALALDVHYDRSLASGSFEVPLLHIVGTQRQRGTIALLGDEGLALKPQPGAAVVDVGADQLPPELRNSFERPILHTYKYSETPPKLLIEAAPPERLPGRFDAQVDTLVSLGDATLIGSASVAIQVKSGRVFALELAIPPGVELLDISAPSLRSRNVASAEDPQLVDLEFTQGLEGQFRVELTYERILGEADREVRVVPLEVRGAEVQQGRIGIEALSAVEVRAATIDGLSPLDVRELPRQLVLRTTNPVLLAYKYAQANPTQGLTLALTRHQMIEVQEAVIDEAGYTTLVTSDGLRVTTCRFQVRNSRAQFLRVTLPLGAEVWSASVDGRPEKPALAAATPGAAGNPQVLLRIINQSSGFPVELTFAAQGPALGRSGRLELNLPRPDVLVTRTRWDVFLPEGLRYGEPSANLQARDPVLEPSSEVDSPTTSGAAPGHAAGAEPPRIVVPAVGTRLGFEKLYANRSDEEAWLRVSYRRAG